MAGDQQITCGVLIGVSLGDSEEDLMRCLRSVLEQSVNGDEFLIIIFLAVERVIQLPKLGDLDLPNNISLQISRVDRDTNLSEKMNRLLDETNNFNLDLIFRLDPDDEMLPHRVATQAKALLQSGHNAMGSSANITYAGTRLKFKKRVKKHVTFKDLLTTNQFLHPTMIFRADFFERYGRYDESLDRAQDWDLWLRAMSQGASMANLATTTTTINVDSGTVARRRETSVIDKKILNRWGIAPGGRHTLKVVFRELLFRFLGK